MRVWWRPATRSASSHAAGRAFTEVIGAEPVDSEGVLHSVRGWFNS